MRPVTVVDIWRRSGDDRVEYASGRAEVLDRLRYPLPLPLELADQF
jgi:hypothetical protein